MHNNEQGAVFAHVIQRTHYKCVHFDLCAPYVYGRNGDYVKYMQSETARRSLDASLQYLLYVVNIIISEIFANVFSFPISKPIYPYNLLH